MIVEYVDSAEPISSELIARKYGLGVRSATVRNELAEITELGYLEQPHTSAGRIPSDPGYRYFVDRLILDRVASEEARAKVRDATSAQEALSELLRETTKVLSRVTQLLSVATAARNSDVKVLHAFTTAIGPDRGLLVTVLENGHVENRIVELPAGVTLDQLGKANELLAAQVEGATLSTLGALRVRQTGQSTLDAILRSAGSSLSTAAREMMRGRLITEGEEYVLAQPELRRDLETMRALLESLEREDDLQAALGANNADGVTIGSENGAGALSFFSILRQRFYVGESEAGLIALLGPKRMDYEQNLAILRFAARAMSETLTQMLK